MSGHRNIVSEPPNTVAVSKKAPATGSIESSSSSSGKADVRKYMYLKKGEGNKGRRNPSRPTKKLTSQSIEPNSESMSAAAGTDHVEGLQVTLCASCDELGSIGNEEAAEPIEPVQAVATCRSVNDARNPISPTFDSLNPPISVQGENPEDLAPSRKMLYTYPSQIAPQEWGSEDRGIPLAVLPYIRLLQARIARLEKDRKELKDYIATLLQELQDMAFKHQKERKEEAEERMRKDEENESRYMMLLNSTMEMKKQHAVEIKEMRDRYKQQEEDRNTQIKGLKNALENMTIQNQSQEKTSSTEIGGVFYNVHYGYGKKTPESQESGKEQKHQKDGEKDVEKLIQTNILTASKQHDGSIKGMSHGPTD